MQQEADRAMRDYEAEILALEEECADLRRKLAASDKLLIEATAEIVKRRAALTEARRWIGDGELSDGLHHDHWTPEYRAAVAMVDAALVPNIQDQPGRTG